MPDQCILQFATAYPMIPTLRCGLLGRATIAIGAGLLLMTALGCLGRSESSVVVYAALDQEFSEPVLREFERSSGIQSLPVFDIESTKTVGLYNRILLERRSPRCDVFWNNEILHTLRLARAGLLEPYRSPSAAEFPAHYRSPQDLWTGFAARARVLLVNTELLPEHQRPASIRDLADPAFRGRCALARPLFGTTATHAAVLFAHWGPEAARRFFDEVRGNAVVLSGNKQVARAVAQGQLAFGLTDTDDAIVELERGAPVAIVFPDQAEGGLGTLFIPNTVCLLRNCRHPAQARRLIDYLLSAEVERALAVGKSAQFPVNPGLKSESRIPGAGGARWMAADFEAAADAWDDAAPWLEQWTAAAERGS